MFLKRPPGHRRREVLTAQQCGTQTYFSNYLKTVRHIDPGWPRGCNLELVIFILTSRIETLSISCKITHH